MCMVPPDPPRARAEPRGNRQPGNVGAARRGAQLARQPGSRFTGGDRHHADRGHSGAEGRDRYGRMDDRPERGSGTPSRLRILASDARPPRPPSCSAHSARVPRPPVRRARSSPGWPPRWWRPPEPPRPGPGRRASRSLSASATDWCAACGDPSAWNQCRPAAHEVHVEQVWFHEWLFTARGCRRRTRTCRR